jgi:hypothetical protein
MAQQNMISVAQRMLELVNKDAKVAEMIAAGDSRVGNLDSFNRQNILRTNLVANVWRKIGRQVLAMHPAVVDEVRMASSDKVPGEIFKTLPYMNPLVIYDDPPVFKSWVRPGGKHRLTPESESSMRLLGFFVFGTAVVTVPGVDGGMSHVEQRVYSTTDPDADRLGIVLMLEVLDEWGKVVDVEFNTMTLYYSDNLTLSETVDALMSRFHFDSDKSQNVAHGDKRVRRWMKEILSTVVGTLFYLCSTILEAEQIPAKTVAKRIPRHISRKPLSMYRVGWTMGGALTRYRQQRDRARPSQMGDERHQQDPQHRKGHFKNQPYGPGRELRKLIYVSPYWTHIERLGAEGVNTARRVPSLGKNQPRESVRTAIETGNINLTETG